MKLFLKKVLLFLGSVMIIVFLSICFNKIYLKVTGLFKLPENINIVILGDSRTRYGINDKYLLNTKNLSADAESYFYSFAKIKELKRNNKQIDTLILSFSKHNILKFIESRWLLNNSHLKERLLVYYPILDLEEILFLLRKKPTQTIRNIFSQILTPYKYMTRKLDGFGGYKDLEYCQLQKEIKNYKAEKEHAFEESTTEMMYLRKIANYCKENQIKLILVNMPFHKTLFESKKEFNSYYKRNFSDITFLDFGGIELNDDNYGDLVHLSPKGSEYFTQQFFIKSLYRSRGLNVSKNSTTQSQIEVQVP